MNLDRERIRFRLSLLCVLSLQALAILNFGGAAVAANSAALAGKWVASRIGNKVVGVIRIDGNKVSGHAGCNSFSGYVEVSERKIAFRNVASTLIGCGGNFVEMEHLSIVEKEFHHALNAVVSYSIKNEKIELEDLNGVIVLILKKHIPQ